MASMVEYFLLLSDMATSADTDPRIALFQSIGLNEQKARETLKNQEVSRSLETTITEVRKVTAPFCFRLDQRNHLGEEDSTKGKSSN